MSKRSKIEKHRAASRRWRAEHKGEVSEYNAAYYEAHKASLRARRRQWYQENKARILEQKRRKYELDKNSELEA